MRTLNQSVTASVIASSGSMVSASLELVLNIKIRLPIISSGARVPMRSETCVRRCTALASLERRTSRLPVVKWSRLP